MPAVMVRLVSLAFGFVIALVAVALSLSQSPSSLDTAGEHETTRSGTAASASASADDTEIARDASGKYHITAQVNGEDTGFLVDTGADVVALTLDDAERLGITVDRDSFQPIAETASGPGYGAPVNIAQIQIAGHEFRDVQAVVIDGLQVNLLGQSLLKRLGRMEVHGDRMVFYGG